MLVAWSALMGIGLGGCLPVSGERVLARDLAQVAPAFSALPPELVLGYTPAPGGRRTYSAAELGRLARRYGLAMEPGSPACFVRPVEALTRERVAAAMMRAMPAARIEVVEFSRQPIPEGELRFPISGLCTPGSTARQSPILWRGLVSRPGYGDFPVWAKVRIQVSGLRVIAVETLAASQRIGPEQVRLEPYDGIPDGIPKISRVMGCTVRRRIAAGAVIQPQMLADPADVVRGELVRAEIRSGRARLVMEAQAERSGSRGEQIPVRNPVNGRVFRARVEGRGQVSVTAVGPVTGKGAQ